ncbi:MAG TPA: L-lactate permease, partial [Burkholderiaceae bacterium]|nr:L-lactate permease [Burkholderiaceae bacterium]
MAVSLAALPIGAVIVLMILFRRAAAFAGSVGLALAAFVAWSFFGYGVQTHAGFGAAGALAGAAAEAAFLTATIVWIVLPALCIHELQVRSGAIDVLRARLRALSDDRRIVAVLIAWFFALFIEGAAGFGTPVALAAPILVSLGYTPVTAVVLAMVGHAAGVSFGAVGTPVLPQLAASGLSGDALAARIALLHGVLGSMLLFFVFRLAGTDEGADTGARADAGIRPWIVAAFAAVCFLVPFAGIAVLLGPELPTLGGAMIGAMLFVLGLRWIARGSSAQSRPLAQPATRSLLPYLVLIALVSVTRLWPAVRDPLQAVSIAWHLGESFGGEMLPLYHPGT